MRSKYEKQRSGISPSTFSTRDFSLGTPESQSYSWHEETISYSPPKVLMGPQHGELCKPHKCWYIICTVPTGTASNVVPAPEVLGQ